MRKYVLDGAESLRSLLECAGYSTVVAAVAKHAVFLDPRIVDQAKGCALFPIIRWRAKAGEPFGQLGSLDERRVLFWDNWGSIDAFEWAAGLARGPDAQVNHVWDKTGRDPAAYTALWNLCVTPSFLAKTTDNNDEVIDTLRFRSYRLYGTVPAGEDAPSAPEGYDELEWAPHPHPVSDLEAELRKRLQRCRTRPTLVACREIGWLFSGWEPDLSLSAPRE